MHPVKVYRRVIPESNVNQVLRAIYRDIAINGLEPEHLKQWYSANCPFPHLRFIPEINVLPEYILRALGLNKDDVGVMCEPQIIWHWPDSEDKPRDQWPHIDSSPEWAKGRPYSRIIGVALTEWTSANGTLRWWNPDYPKDDSRKDWPNIVELDPGDVVVMRPDVPHTAGVNLGSTPRSGVYFRYLKVVDTPLGL